MPIPGIIRIETTSNAACGKAAAPAAPRLVSAKRNLGSSCIWRDRLEPVNCAKEASPAPPAPIAPAIGADTGSVAAATPAANGAAI